MPHEDGSASLQLESFRRQAGGVRYFKADFLDVLSGSFSVQSVGNVWKS